MINKKSFWHWAVYLDPHENMNTYSAISTSDTSISSWITWLPSTDPARTRIAAILKHIVIICNDACFAQHVMSTHKSSSYRFLASALTQLRYIIRTHVGLLSRLTLGRGWD